MVRRALLALGLLAAFAARAGATTTTTTNPTCTYNYINGTPTQDCTLYSPSSGVYEILVDTTTTTTTSSTTLATTTTTTGAGSTTTSTTTTATTTTTLATTTTTTHTTTTTTLATTTTTTTTTLATTTSTTLAGSVIPRFAIDARNATYDAIFSDAAPATTSFTNLHWPHVLISMPCFGNSCDNFAASRYPHGLVYKDAIDGTLYGTHLLKDAGGTPLCIKFPLNCSSCTQTAADIGDPAFRTAWIADMTTLLGGGSNDGLLMDDMNDDLTRVGDCNTAAACDNVGPAHCPKDPRTGLTMTLEDWRRYLAEFAEAVRAAFPHPKLIAHNPVFFLGFPDSDTFVARRVAASDIQAMERGVIGVPGGAGVSGIESYFNYVDQVHERTGVTSWNSPNSGSTNTAALRETNLAAYQLTNNGNDYIGSQPDGGTIVDWWPGFESDLGIPTDTRAQDGQGVWVRHFTKGIAYYNEAGALTKTETPGGTLVRLDESLATSVSLPAATGAVLRNQAPGFARNAGSATGYDIAYGVARDASNNLFLGGIFSGTLTPAVTIGGSGTSAGNGDGFVIKYNASGTVQWATQFGGTADDQVSSVAVDGSGNPIVYGVFRATTTFCGTPVTPAGQADLFVVKLNGSTGAQTWCKTFGSTGNETAAKVAVDASGNPIFTGSFGGTIDFGGGPMAPPLGAGDLDVFVAKLNGSTGAYVAARHWPNTGIDVGLSIAVDSGTSRIALAGSFINAINFASQDFVHGTDSGTTGRLFASNSVSDGFVAVFDSSLAHLWSRQIGAPTDEDKARDVIFDGSQNVVVGGYSISAVDFGGGSRPSLGNADGWVASYTNTTGAWRWDHRVGGGGDDYVNGLAYDPIDQSIVAVAQTTSSGNYGNGTLAPVVAGGSNDAVDVRYNAADGSIVHAARHMGGSNHDVPNAVVVLSTGQPAIAGYFYGTWTAGFTLGSLGQSDAYLAVRAGP